MPPSKIPALPAAGTLEASDLFPLEQSAGTRKASLAALQAALVPPIPAVPAAILVESGPAAKVSALDEVSALTGDEMVPLVQSGGTKKAALAALRGWLQEPTAVTQTTWFLRSTGSDSNDGATADTALATCAELARRFRNKRVAQNIEIDVGPGVFDRLVLDCVVDTGVRVHVFGSVTQSAPFTLTAVTNQASASNTRGLISADTSAFALRQRLRVTTGASAGYRAFVTRVLSATQANVSGWTADSTLFAYGPSFSDSATIPVGSQVVVETLDTSVAGITVRSGRKVTGVAPVEIENVSIAGDIQSCSSVLLSRCRVISGNITNSYDVSLRQCVWDASTTFEFSRLGLSGGNYLVQAFVNASVLSVLAPLFASASTGNVIQLGLRSLMQLASPLEISSASGTGALRINDMSAVSIVAGARVWGANNSFSLAAFYTPGAGSWVQYAAATPPIVTGAPGGADVRIGSTNFSYAGLPAVVAALGSGWGQA